MKAKKCIKIVLANCPIDDGNRGCVALTLTSLYLIDKIMKDAGVTYELYMLDTYLRAKKKCIVNIGDRTIEFQPISYPYGIEFKEIIKSILFLKDTYKSTIIIKNSDFILDIGKGDSFSDIYGKTRFKITDRIHRIARFFSIPYCFLPQTIGPFENKKVKSRAFKSLLRADLVMARDEASYIYVKQNVPLQKNIKEYIDVAFFLPYNRSTYDSKYIHVGLNISSLLWKSGYTGKNQFDLICNYQEVIKKIIDFFVKRDNVILHIVPHVIGKSHQIEGDTMVSLKLIKEYSHERILLAPYFSGPIEAKNYISGLDFFMGARMHSTIAAFSSGVPVVPMAYSRKFNGLFEATLDYHYMVDLKQASNEDALKTITSAFEQRAMLKETIQERLDGVVEEKKQKLYNDLTKFLQL